jgi:hypothetical protein
VVTSVLVPGGDAVPGGVRGTGSGFALPGSEGAGDVAVTTSVVVTITMLGTLAGVAVDIAVVVPSDSLG